MTYCTCDKPRVGRSPDFCGACLIRLDPRVLSTDKTIIAFQSQVNDLPGELTPALAHARKRDRAGRGPFGLAYLGADRDNPAEGCEEGADGINYSFYEWLKDRRETGRDEIDPDLLDAAHHFALAHAALERRRR